MYVYYSYTYTEQMVTAATIGTHAKRKGYVFMMVCFDLGSIEVPAEEQYTEINWTEFVLNFDGKWKCHGHLVIDGCDGGVFFGGEDLLLFELSFIQSLIPLDYVEHFQHRNLSKKFPCHFNVAIDQFFPVRWFSLCNQMKMRKIHLSFHSIFIEIVFCIFFFDMLCVVTVCAK